MRRANLLVGLLFALSGAAALVYQVAWQRILALHSGVGIYSIAVIVAAFMAGLGIGSHLGGLSSARLTPRAALRAFALLELGIGLFAAGSTPLYYDLLYGRAAGLYGPLWRSALLHFAALLPPTTLMGMSLPFLVRAMVRETATAGRTIGWLYGINVVGAAMGALAAPWLLIRHLGVAGAVGVGAATNAVVGAGALALGRWATATRENPAVAAVPVASTPPEPRPFALWVALYAASGFCALSLELVWFRLVDVAVKSTAFTFGTVLAVYLVGYAAGSLAAAPRVGKLERPLRIFLLLQSALLAISVASVVALVSLPEQIAPLRWYVEYWARPEGLRLGRTWDPGAIARLYVLLPVALYGVPTFLMGAAFPVLQRAVQDDPQTSGRKVGILQAANIAGCVAGSLLVGLVSLDLAGTTGTLRLLALAGVGFAALGVRAYGPRGPFTALVTLLTALVVAVPGESALWARLHGFSGNDGFFDEDATGVVALTPEIEREGEWRLSVNGTWNSSLPYGGVHTWLGAIPALVHPQPEHVAIIGLGSGDTAWAAACRRETRTEQIFEICSPQLRLLRRLAGADAPPPKLRHFLRDPRVEVRFADGRHAVESGTQLFDVIEADALRPYHAGSGNLYSLEFFERMGRRLKRGGVLCTWAPTSRTYATFVRAFPHVLEFSRGQILVGSHEPLPIDVAAWTARLHAARPYLGGDVADQVLARLRTARPAEPRPESDVNRDLFPRDEFATPR